LLLQCGHQSGLSESGDGANKKPRAMAGRSVSASPADTPLLSDRVRTQHGFLFSFSDHS